MLCFRARGLVVTYLLELVISDADEVTGVCRGRTTPEGLACAGKRP